MGNTNGCYHQIGRKYSSPFFAFLSFLHLLSPFHLVVQIIDLSVQILLASQGSDILDGVFLRPSSPASTSIMVEFFAPLRSPSSEGESAEVAFPGAREHEAVAKSLGLRYIPWVKDR